MTLEENKIRFIISISIFFIFILAEILFPKRPLSNPRTIRWIGNLGLALVDSFLVRLVFPTAAVGFALVAEEKQWGLFHNLELSLSLKTILTLLFLDFSIYVQHFLVHHIPILWRLHRVHHSDTDLDASSGFRFHPIEILLSMAFKGLLILLIGAPASAVLIFEIILNGVSIFNHSNLKLPIFLEKWLRLMIVTPDYHRVHHSIIQKETNSNFGFNLPWWDYLFKTYRAQPKSGHLEMKIGIKRFRKIQDSHLVHLLAQPFKK